MSHTVGSGPSRLGLVAAFLTVYLCWGATFLALRYVVAEIPPLLAVAARCAGGAAIVGGWLWWRGALVRPTAAEWWVTLGSGVLLFVGCHGVMAWAEVTVPSGEASVLMATIPLWLVGFVGLAERRVPSRTTLAGLALGFGGVVLLSSRRDLGGEAGGLLERVGLAGASASWALGSLFGRREPRLSTAQTMTMQLASGALTLVAVAAVSGSLVEWAAVRPGPRAVSGLGFLIVGGTVAGFGAYTWLLRVASPAAAGSYAFVNPLVALLLAWVVGDGALTAPMLAAALAILAAVGLLRVGAAGRRRTA
ncbi:MAG: EamA family transporter [Gemmatimonadales bacterium]